MLILNYIGLWGKIVNISKNKIINISIWILGILLTLIVFVLLIINISPRPVSYLIRKNFEKGIKTMPSNYNEYLDKVNIIRDLTYESKYKDNKADLFFPKNGNNFPVIIWVHGGAFVGGDKTDAEYYNVLLSSFGYVVLSINYERSPESKYPNQLKQLEEVYSYLLSIASIYNIDTSKIFLAGDSAGGHMVSQFTLIQTNNNYAKEMDFKQVIPKENIKGLLLYCGPYNVSKIKETKNKIVAFVLSNTAWSYFGTRSWSKLYGKEATIKNHISSDFPPTFITDGNSLSFEDHAKELEEALKEKNIEVKSYYIDKKIKASHEYQFKLDTEIGMESLYLTKEFLDKHKN